MKIWLKCQDVCRGESNIGEYEEEGRKGVNIDQSEGVAGVRRAGGGAFCVRARACRAAAASISDGSRACDVRGACW